jgi:uncharacterized protein (TIGR03382 family)
MKKMIFSAVAVLGFAGAAFAGGPAGDSLAYWGQNDNALPGGGFGFQVGDFPQGADNGLQAGAANITFGGGDLGANNGVKYNWLQSFAGTTTNAQFGASSGGSIAIQNGTGGVNNGAFLEFNFDATSYEAIAFSFAAQRTSTGFNDVTIAAYDGESFLGNIATGQTWASSFALEVYSTSLLDGVSDATIRMTFNGGSTSSSFGNNRLDNLLIQGTLIPTPGSAALIGLAGLAAVRRRR